MTTLQITDIASNLLSSTTEASSALGESTATNISQGFSIFSNLLSSAFSDSQGEASSTSNLNNGQANQLLGQEEVVSTIQQQLFSSIGLDFANKDATGSSSSILSGITSDASISTMQGVLLQSLQTNLLSSISKNEQAARTVETNEETISSIMSFAFGDDGIALTDGFDAVNVLQHIPIVSSIYQQATETDISAISKLAGGFLYGGTTGLAFSALDIAIEGFSGHSINDSILSFDYSGFAKQLFSNDDETATASTSNATSNSAQLFSLAKQVAQQTGV